MRIFISHSSKDFDVASKICKRLEQEKHSCFFAPRDIRSGYEYAEEIINGIDGSEVVLLLMSREANQSPHVLREIERAVSKKKPIIVYKLEEVALSKSMEYFLMTHQWLSTDGSGDFSDIIQRINEYAAAHEDIAEQPQTAVSYEQAEKAGAPRRRAWVIIAAAAAVLAVGAGTGIYLSTRTDVQPSASIADKSTDVSQTLSVTSSEIPAQTIELSEQPAETQSSAASTQGESIAEMHGESSASPQTDAPPAEEIPSETTASTTAAEIQAPAEQPQESAAKAEIGDKLLFGTYNGEPILWRVLRVSEDGKQAVVISDKILTMKAYDAAEGGTYNKYEGNDYWTAKLSDIPQDIQRLIRGDNRWEQSNIRTWLNSEKENVVYSGQAPTSKAMSELRNGYHTEAGFLNGFTKAERDALAESEITTNGTITRDKVFLLSSGELDWLYEADISIFAEPTAAAVEQDKSQWYKVNSEAYNVSDHFWWLRDANPENACQCYYINISWSDVRISSGSVGLEGYGIRPAMTLDLTSQAVKEALRTE